MNIEHIATSYAESYSNEFGHAVDYSGPFDVQEGKAFTFCINDDAISSLDSDLVPPIIVVADDGAVGEFPFLSQGWEKIISQIPDEDEE